jgi:SAM-dependent methyltransferase
MQQVLRGVMKQNKYDDDAFFDKYSQMPRSIYGLDGAGEWPVFRKMFPELKGRSVLDIGCGFGWHCRYAHEQGARRVVGIDISEKMLKRAESETHAPEIEYRRLAIEDMDFAAAEFDVVISSLAIHYVESFDMVCQKVHHCLAGKGTFVFSVEHPIYTALAAQDWCYGSQGEKLHWPVDNYHNEGLRQAEFLVDDVVKYHRTFATFINTLIGSGFKIAAINELKPTQDMLDSNPAYEEELRRPIFMMISAVKE